MIRAADDAMHIDAVQHCSDARDASAFRTVQWVDAVHIKNSAPACCQACMTLLAA